MHLRISVLVTVAAVIITAAAPAAAQVTAQRRPSTTSSRPPAIGIRGYFSVDLESMAAQKSFDAVLGTSTLTGFGGGADVLNVWKTLFVRVAVSHTSKVGSRAFVFNGEAISLGIPLTVSMTPIEIGAGWQLATRGRVKPYAGGGLLLMKYSEKSTFAGAGDDVSRSNRGFTAFGGAEVGVTKWLMAGAEAQYRGVPNALGAAPVSQDFGETNLGGFTVRVLVGFKR